MHSQILLSFHPRPNQSHLFLTQILSSGEVPTAAPKAEAAIAAKLAGYPGTALAAGCHRSVSCVHLSLSLPL